MNRLLHVFLGASLLVACGDTVENQMSMSVVASEDDLPECTDDNVGAQAVVKNEGMARVCVDGRWKKNTSGSANADMDFSCTTKELKDESGIKIICNGDSIGVVLNGEKGDAGMDGKDGEKGESGQSGAAGKDGSGCTVSQSDSLLIITCGEKKTTIDFVALLNKDSTVLDSEAIPVSLDSLAGYSQKGPFLKGSTVYLYELADGRTLKQTNGNFTSNIVRDDGYYKFNARDLISQYALIVVDGHYRNEVTGNISNSTIRLKAISDVHKHNTSANVNLLTHLEYERVYYLVTKKKMKVSAAKRQAQREILEQFHIKLDGDTDSENMDLFGDSEADAALLALSILLQGDRTEAEMSALLTEISNDMAQDGVWDDSTANVDSLKAAIADWAFDQDLSEFRANVDGWNLGNGMGDFETIIRDYIAKIYGIVPCGESYNDSTRTIENKWSKHNKKTYTCINGNLITKRIENIYLNPDIEYGKLLDTRDRKVYSIVKIGAQVWMAENLDYADSVAYPAIKNNSACNGGNPDNCDTLGRLYTWSAAMDSAAVFTTNGYGCGDGKTCSPEFPARGICPEGWHLPSRSDWEIMLAMVGGQEMGSKALRSKAVLGSDSDDLDYYGFSLIVDNRVSFWTSDEYAGFYRASYVINFDGSANSANFNYDYKSSRFFIRCLMD